jgi:hypothetical protein
MPSPIGLATALSSEKGADGWALRSRHPGIEALKLGMAAVDTASALQPAEPQTLCNDEDIAKAGASCYPPML